MSGIGFASPLQFFLGVLRTVKHAQHEDDFAGNDVENPVRKIAEIHASDVGKAHCVKERLVTQTAEHLFGLRLQTESDSRLAALIPGGRFGEVNRHEPVKVEPEPHGRYPRKSGLALLLL